MYEWYFLYPELHFVFFLLLYFLNSILLLLLFCLNISKNDSRNPEQPVPKTFPLSLTKATVLVGTKNNGIWQWNTALKSWKWNVLRSLPLMSWLTSMFIVLYYLFHAEILFSFSLKIDLKRLYHYKTRLNLFISSKESQILNKSTLNWWPVIL